MCIQQTGGCIQKQNIFALEYLDDHERIADLINVVYFMGKGMICPEDIHEMDSVVTKVRRVWGKVTTWSYTRDFLRKVAMGTQYILIGLEHQSDINFAMPVRLMGYDSGTYEKQIRRLKKAHRMKKDLKNYEFTSGIAKKDRLMPVLSTVLYFGREKWTGPRDLHGMMDLDGELAPLKNWIPNYKINILEVRRYPNWKAFQTDLRQVFGLLYHTVDGKDVQEYIKTNKTEYENLTEDTYDLISEVTGGTKLKEFKENHRTKEGGVNMSDAFQECIDREAARAAAESEARVTLIIRFLMDHSREDEIRRVLDDKEYRNKVYDEIKG